MATVAFAYNHSRDPMNPGHLGQQIQAALTLGVAPQVDIAPTSISVRHPNVTEANRTQIQSLIDVYVYDPDWDATPEGKQVSAVKAKAALVLAGQTTFTAAELQKIAAALILRQQP